MSIIRHEKVSTIPAHAARGASATVCEQCASSQPGPKSKHDRACLPTFLTRSVRILLAHSSQGWWLSGGWCFWMQCWLFALWTQALTEAWTRSLSQCSYAVAPEHSEVSGRITVLLTLKRDNDVWTNIWQLEFPFEGRQKFVLLGLVVCLHIYSTNILLLKK